MCLATIILISYNENEFLPIALDSCVNQTIDDLEIIIGDDGSTDDSLNTIRNYAERYSNIRYFQMDRPSLNHDIIASFRVSGIIKRALEMATGKYICILSGDDYFTDMEKIQTAVDFLEKAPKYSAFVSGFEYVGAWQRKVHPKSLSAALYWSWTKDYLHISCFVFRKPDITRLPDRFFDDTGLQYVLARMGKWHFSSAITFAYNQRKNSIMSSADKIELKMIEMMVFQDVLNCHVPYSPVFSCCTGSRFYLNLLLCFMHRDVLKNAKYVKYLKSCQQYRHDILGVLYNYDEQSVFNRIRFKVFLLKTKYQHQLIEKIISRREPKSGKAN